MKDLERIACRVVGVTFEGRQKFFDVIENGDDVTLKREPWNAFDKRAIGVHHNNNHIGYVPAYMAKDIAPKIDKLKRTELGGMVLRVMRGDVTGVEIVFYIPRQETENEESD